METLQSLSDADLILLFQQGNLRAFDRLVNRHKRRIFLKIVSMVKDRHLAEDILQDTFIKILSSLKAYKYHDDGRFGLWALRIAYNLCIDHKRMIARKPALILFADPAEEADITAIEESCEKNYLRGLASISIQKLLLALPPEQRQVIFYRHFEQMSFKQIAALTHTSLNTTLGRMRYGLMKLRKLMKDKCVVSIMDISLYQ